MGKKEPALGEDNYFTQVASGQRVTASPLATVGKQAGAAIRSLTSTIAQAPSVVPSAWDKFMQVITPPRYAPVRLYDPASPASSGYGTLPVCMPGDPCYGKPKAQVQEDRSYAPTSEAKSNLPVYLAVGGGVVLLALLLTRR